jgi:hypothetical protein
MKIAIMFSGLTRIFKQTYKNYLRMLNGKDVDVYIHTWDIFSDFKNPNKGLDELKAMYKPTKIVMDNYESFSNIEWVNTYAKIYDDLKVNKDGWVHNSANMKTGLIVQHYGLKKVIELIEDLNCYDVIIRSRFDFDSKSSIDWDDLYKETENHLLVPAGKNNGLKGTKYSICDLFAASRPKHMKKYCSLLDCLLDERYMQDIMLAKCNIPEYLLALHLIRDEVPFKQYQFKYTEFKNIKNRKKGERGTKNT